MKVQLTETACIVTREPGDPKFHASNGWGSGESRLLYHIKQELIKQGYDVIKKLMWKDGHMVDDTQHYIRDRKGKWAIWFSDYALRFSYEDYNAGQLVLTRETLA